VTKLYFAGSIFAGTSGIAHTSSIRARWRSGDHLNSYLRVDAGIIGSEDLRGSRNFGRI
jgi:hypothetical protein